MTETTETSAAVEANRTATAAATEAGSGAADSIAVTCDLIRMGVFFDGTGNSRDHAGTGDISWHTNVDLLEHRYESTGGPVERVVEQQRRMVNYDKNYYRGIGVEVGGDTTTLGMARGTGAEGVRLRVADAVNALRVQLRTMARGMEVCDVWFDAFGFSRGAAAARHFANTVQNGGLTVSGADARVKFLGLFDTVVMIGGHSTDGGNDNVQVETRNVADRIVHITANDEIRHNFPLTLAFGEQRIRMVGAHSHIGGGYNPTNPADASGTFAFEEEDYPGLPDYLERNWGLSEGNQIGADSESPDSLIVVRQSDWQPHDAGERHYTFNHSTQHGLQFVSLRLMYERAVAAGVPFEALTSSIEGTDISISPMLASYYRALQSGAVRPEQERAVRLRYAHVSFNRNRTWGVRPHLPITSGRRLTVTR